MRLRNLTVCGMKNPLGISGENVIFSWIIQSEKENLFQTSYRIVVMENSIIFWDSEWIQSEKSTGIIYTGPEFQGMGCYTWYVEVCTSDGEKAKSEEQTFEIALSADQQKAQWIEPVMEPNILKRPEGILENDVTFESGDDLQPASYLRKEFICNKEIKKARMYITAHGVYEAYINGSKVDDRYLAPEYSSYYKNLLFQTYDITDHLLQNGNAVGVILGDGWWCGSNTNGDTCVYGRKRALWMQIEIEYADGERESIISDKSFRCSTGPILFSDIFIGETYDARKEIPGWNQYGYSQKDWLKVSDSEEKVCVMHPQENPPVRIIRRFRPKKIWQAPNGETLLDVGENIAGFLSFQIKAPEGTEITLQHAEVLDENGNYFHNLRFTNNLQMIRYICNGNEETEYYPHFTFQGFRYVRLKGNVEFCKEQFWVNVLSSDNPVTGSFSCSDSKLNMLQQNIVRSQTANFISIPTDCPQRERAGWTGDAEVFSATACFNRNILNFMKKWMTDLRCDQKENGIVSVIVPAKPEKFSDFMGTEGITGWSDACVIIPYVIYKKLGDLQILKANYSCMKKWMDYVRKRAASGNPEIVLNSNMYKEEKYRRLTDYLWNTDNHYGDWLIPSLTTGDIKSIFYGANSTKDIFATAYFAETSRMMVEIAEILGYTDDQKEFSELHLNIKQAFQTWYMDENGIVSPDFQGAIVIALYFNLIPEDKIKINVKHLIQKIEENNGCLDTGFLSVPYILDALSEHGKVKEAFDLLFQEKCPSWLYEVKMGATSIWESWGAIDENGVPKACSYNHYAFGSVGDWMYRNIGGLRPEKPGYQEFVVEPKMDDRISWSNINYDCCYGRISIHWKKEQGSFALDLEVPVNTSCKVILPSGKTLKYGSGKYHIVE